jgi:hypothetical protein
MRTNMGIFFDPGHLLLPKLYCPWKYTWSMHIQNLVDNVPGEGINNEIPRTRYIKIHI